MQKQAKTIKRMAKKFKAKDVVAKMFLTQVSLNISLISIHKIIGHIVANKNSGIIMLDFKITETKNMFKKDAKYIDFFVFTLVKNMLEQCKNIIDKYIMLNKKQINFNI